MARKRSQTPAPSTQILLTIDRDLLAALNREAIRAGISRAELIRQCLAFYMRTPSTVRARPSRLVHKRTK